MSETGHPRPFDRRSADAHARVAFDDLWADADPWELDHSPLDQRRYARELELLADRRYGRALEIGCAAGSFTRLLSACCDEVLAIDVSERALARAVAAGAPDNVEYRCANVMEFDVERSGPWDLVVLAETAYYLGWLYPLFDLGWLAHALRERTRPGGRLLLVNTFGPDTGIMSPWLIRTYRDLFVHAGYRVEHEETMRGEKQGVTLEILLSVFVA